MIRHWDLSKRLCVTVGIKKTIQEEIVLGDTDRVFKRGE